MLAPGLRPGCAHSDPDGDLRADAVGLVDSRPDLEGLLGVDRVLYRCRIEQSFLEANRRVQPLCEVAHGFTVVGGSPDEELDERQRRLGTVRGALEGGREPGVVDHALCGVAHDRLRPSGGPDHRGVEAVGRRVKEPELMDRTRPVADRYRDELDVTWRRRYPLGVLRLVRRVDQVGRVDHTVSVAAPPAAGQPPARQDVPRTFTVGCVPGDADENEDDRQNGQELAVCQVRTEQEDRRPDELTDGRLAPAVVRPARDGVSVNCFIAHGVSPRFVSE